MEQKVKEQYTKYTYPKYNDNMDRLAPIPNQYTSNLFLEQINYYIYNGSKPDFNNYKILVAGVGLGDDIINMAFFLKKYKNTKLLGIDISSTALDICKKRIEKYDLNNIELIEMSLLDLNVNIHGKFDLIICIGVLHHLVNPVDGINSLKNVMEDDGFMNIMVYGKYGRTGIYQMQDLMKKINYNIHDYPSKIRNFKNLYKQLPINNWFNLGEHLINDHNVSDEGIVDLLLHCQDRSYSVPELYEWIDTCGLNIIEFSPETRYKYKHTITDFNYPDNIVEKYSINELFFGDIIKHSFYISKNIVTKAKIENLDNIPILVLMTQKTLNNILNIFKTKKASLNLKSYDICVNTTFHYKLTDEYLWYFTNNNCFQFDIEMNDITYIILNNIDNIKTTSEIFNIVRKELNSDIDNSEILNIFKPVYEKFELYDMILLKSL